MKTYDDNWQKLRDEQQTPYTPSRGYTTEKPLLRMFGTGSGLEYTRRYPEYTEKIRCSVNSGGTAMARHAQARSKDTFLTLLNRMDVGSKLQWFTLRTTNTTPREGTTDYLVGRIGLMDWFLIDREGRLYTQTRLTPKENYTECGFDSRKSMTLAQLEQELNGVMR